MRLSESLLYGIIQGLCEFLPVSSSGHLALTHSFFGDKVLSSPLAYDILLHLGTLIAVFVFYAEDLKELVRSFFSLIPKLFRRGFRLSLCTVGERCVIYVALATIPMTACGFFKDLQNALIMSPIFVGAMLIINSALLFVIGRVGKRKKGEEEMTLSDALRIGFMQLLAFFPGISRSGSTLLGGTLSDLDGKSAVKFSFLLSIPTVLGACLLELPELFSVGLSKQELLIYTSGALAAAISGVIAIRAVQIVSKKSLFGYFSLYCFALGAIAVILGIYAL